VRNLASIFDTTRLRAARVSKRSKISLPEIYDKRGENLDNKLKNEMRHNQWTNEHDIVFFQLGAHLLPRNSAYTTAMGCSRLLWQL